MEFDTHEPLLITLQVTKLRRDLYSPSSKHYEQPSALEPHALATFLLRYRTTPHATTGVAPCALFCNRMLRTRLDLLAPDVRGKVQDQQLKQKLSHDKSALRELQGGQVVWARDLRGGPRWVRATVQEYLGPVSYRVQLENGELWRRQLDHLREGPSREGETLERRDGPEVPDWQYASWMHESETVAEAASSEPERDSGVSESTRPKPLQCPGVNPSRPTPRTQHHSVVIRRVDMCSPTVYMLHWTANLYGRNVMYLGIII